MGTTIQFVYFGIRPRKKCENQEIIVERLFPTCTRSLKFKFCHQKSIEHFYLLIVFSQKEYEDEYYCKELKLKTNRRP